MAKAQFQLNPRPGRAFVIRLKSELLKVICLSKFICNTEHFLREGEMERWEVGNQPMFFLLSPYKDLEYQSQILVKQGCIQFAPRQSGSEFKYRREVSGFDSG